MVTFGVTRVVAQNGNFPLDQRFPLWQLIGAMADHPLKTFRDNHGLTQPALAKQLGVTTATISRWESGTRSPRKAKLPEIIEKTGISPAALLGIEDHAEAV